MNERTKSLINEVFLKELLLYSGDQQGDDAPGWHIPGHVVDRIVPLEEGLSLSLHTHTCMVAGLSTLSIKPPPYIQKKTGPPLEKPGSLRTQQKQASLPLTFLKTFPFDEGKSSLEQKRKREGEGGMCLRRRSVDTSSSSFACLHG